MATRLLNNLTQAELNEAVSQIFRSPKFWTVNSHVPAAQRDQLRYNAVTRRIWPDFPLFSPYAQTHDAYSQSMFSHLPMVSTSANFYKFAFLEPSSLSTVSPFGIPLAT